MKKEPRKGQFQKGNKVGVQFKKGGAGNPKGRPRKSFNQISNYLKEVGVPELTREQLLTTYKVLFNATEQQLKDIMDDPDVPYALKIIIAELNHKQRRMIALKDLRDYVFGKATENRNVNVTQEQPLFWRRGEPMLTEGEIIEILAKEAEDE